MISTHHRPHLTVGSEKGGEKVEKATIVSILKSLKDSIETGKLAMPGYEGARKDGAEYAACYLAACSTALDEAISLLGEQSC